MSNCWCHECNKNVFIKTIPYPVTQMILCPTCGNKRCPHATDHRLACTSSNDPGQIGSIYGVYPHPSKDLLDFVYSKDGDSN